MTGEEFSWKGIVPVDVSRVDESFKNIFTNHSNTCYAASLVDCISTIINWFHFYQLLISAKSQSLTSGINGQLTNYRQNTQAILNIIAINRKPMHIDNSDYIKLCIHVHVY